METTLPKTGEPTGGTSTKLAIYNEAKGIIGDKLTPKAYRLQLKSEGGKRKIYDFLSHHRGKNGGEPLQEFEEWQKAFDPPPPPPIKEAQYGKGKGMLNMKPTTPIEHELPASNPTFNQPVETAPVEPVVDGDKVVEPANPEAPALKFESPEDAETFAAEANPDSTNPEEQPKIQYKFDSAVHEKQFLDDWQTDPDILAWRKSMVEEFGEDPSPDNPDYNYRKAWVSGDRPQMTEDGKAHWGSIVSDGTDLKGENHPTKWKSDYYEVFGISPEGLSKADAIKELQKAAEMERAFGNQEGGLEDGEPLVAQYALPPELQAALEAQKEKDEATRTKNLRNLSGIMQKQSFSDVAQGKDKELAKSVDDIPVNANTEPFIRARKNKSYGMYFLTTGERQLAEHLQKEQEGIMKGWRIVDGEFVIEEDLSRDWSPSTLTKAQELSNNWSPLVKPMDIQTSMAVAHIYENHLNELYNAAVAYKKVAAENGFSYSVDKRDWKYTGKQDEPSHPMSGNLIGMLDDRNEETQRRVEGIYNMLGLGGKDYPQHRLGASGTGEDTPIQNEAFKLVKQIGERVTPDFTGAFKGVNDYYAAKARFDYAVQAFRDVSRVYLTNNSFAEVEDTGTLARIIEKAREGNAGAIAPKNAGVGVWTEEDSRHNVFNTLYSSGLYDMMKTGGMYDPENLIERTGREPDAGQFAADMTGGLVGFLPTLMATRGMVMLGGGARLTQIFGAMRNGSALQKTQAVIGTALMEEVIFQGAGGGGGEGFGFALGGEATRWMGNVRVGGRYGGMVSAIINKSMGMAATGVSMTTGMKLSHMTGELVNDMAGDEVLMKDYATALGLTNNKGEVVLSKGALHTLIEIGVNSFFGLMHSSQDHVPFKDYLNKQRQEYRKTAAELEALGHADLAEMVYNWDNTLELTIDMNQKANSALGSGAEHFAPIKEIRMTEAGAEIPMVKEHKNDATPDVKIEKGKFVDAKPPKKTLSETVEDVDIPATPEYERAKTNNLTDQIISEAFNGVPEKEIAKRLNKQRSSGAIKILDANGIPLKGKKAEAEIRKMVDATFRHKGIPSIERLQKLEADYAQASILTRNAGKYRELQREIGEKGRQIDQYRELVEPEGEAPKPKAEGEKAEAGKDNTEANEKKRVYEEAIKNLEAEREGLEAELEKMPEEKKLKAVGEKIEKLTQAKNHWRSGLREYFYPVDKTKHYSRRRSVDTKEVVEDKTKVAERKFKDEQGKNYKVNPEYRVDGKVMTEAEAKKWIDKPSNRERVLQGKSKVELDFVDPKNPVAQSVKRLNSKRRPFTLDAETESNKVTFAEAEGKSLFKYNEANDTYERGRLVKKPIGWVFRSGQAYDLKNIKKESGGKEIPVEDGDVIGNHGVFLADAMDKQPSKGKHPAYLSGDGKSLEYKGNEYSVKNINKGKDGKATSVAAQKLNEKGEPDGKVVNFRNDDVLYQANLFGNKGQLRDRKTGDYKDGGVVFKNLEEGKNGEAEIVTYSGTEEVGRTKVKEDKPTDVVDEAPKPEVKEEENGDTTEPKPTEPVAEPTGEAPNPTGNSGGGGQPPSGGTGASGGKGGETKGNEPKPKNEGENGGTTRRPQPSGGTAQPTPKVTAKPRGSVSRRTVTTPTGTEGGGDGRPPLHGTDYRNLPTPTEYVVFDKYQIDEHQHYAINAALTNFYNNSREGFVIADGTGVGKTRILLGTAREIADMKGKPVLIVTENKQVVDTSFMPEAKKSGIGLDNIELATYSGIKDQKNGELKAKYAEKDYAAVIFDEAHNLKNSMSAKSVAGMSIKAEKAMFATATPMDRPTGATYFLAKMLNRSQEAVMDELGYHIETRQTASGTTYDVATPKKGFSWEAVFENMLKMRDQAEKEGAFLRRNYPFYGEIEEMMHVMDIHNEGLLDVLDSNWENKSETNKAMTKTGEMSRLTEKLKAEVVWESMYEDLVAGKKVIVIAEGVKPTVLRGLSDADYFTNRVAKIKEAHGEEVAAKIEDAYRNYRNTRPTQREVEHELQALYQEQLSSKSEKNKQYVADEIIKAEIAALENPATKGLLDALDAIIADKSIPFEVRALAEELSVNGNPVQRNNIFTLKEQRRKDKSKPPKAREGVILNPIIKELGARINEELGVEGKNAYSEVYGDGNKSTEVDRFQNDEVDVLLATPKSGGTGISLDDQVGDAPRQLYMATANYAGDQFQQILGRVSRKNTKSPAKASVVFSTDGFGMLAVNEGKRAEILQKKMEVLKAIQEGADPDAAAGMDVSEGAEPAIVKANAGKTNTVPLTGEAGLKPFIKPEPVVEAPKPKSEPAKTKGFKPTPVKTKPVVETPKEKTGNPHIDNIPEEELSDIGALTGRIGDYDLALDMELRENQVGDVIEFKDNDGIQKGEVKEVGKDNYILDVDGKRVAVDMEHVHTEEAALLRDALKFIRETRSQLDAKDRQKRREAAPEPTEPTTSPEPIPVKEGEATIGQRVDALPKEVLEEKIYPHIQDISTLTHSIYATGFSSIGGKPSPTWFGFAGENEAGVKQGFKDWMWEVAKLPDYFSSPKGFSSAGIYDTALKIEKGLNSGEYQHVLTDKNNRAKANNMISALAELPSFSEGQRLAMDITHNILSGNKEGAMVGIERLKNLSLEANKGELEALHKFDIEAIYEEGGSPALIRAVNEALGLKPEKRTHGEPVEPTPAKRAILFDEGTYIQDQNTGEVFEVFVKDGEEVMVRSAEKGRATKTLDPDAEYVEIGKNGIIDGEKAVHNETTDAHIQNLIDNGATMVNHGSYGGEVITPKGEEALTSFKPESYAEKPVVEMQGDLYSSSTAFQARLQLEKNREVELENQLEALKGEDPEGKSEGLKAQLDKIKERQTAEAARLKEEYDKAITSRNEYILKRADAELDFYDATERRTFINEFEHLVNNEKEAAKPFNELIDDLIEVNKKRRVFENDKSKAPKEGEFVATEGFKEAFMSESDRVVKGHQTRIAMPDGSHRDARYAVVEADDVAASHLLASDRATYNPLYPTQKKTQTLNSRDYTTDEQARQWTWERSLVFDPEQMISSALEPSVGMPVISVDGVVKSGNGRVMMYKAAIENGTTNGYRDHLLKKAKDFGISESEIQHMANPILVRVDLTRGRRYSVKEMHSFNGDPQKAQKSTDKAVMVSKMFSGEEFNDVRKEITDMFNVMGSDGRAKYSTFSEFFKDKAATERVIDALIKAGVIEKSARHTMFKEKKGEISSEGKTIVQSVLQGGLFDERIVGQLIKGNLKGLNNTKISKLLVPLYRMGGLEKRHDLTPYVNDALYIISKHRASGSEQSLAQHIFEPKLFIDEIHPEEAKVLAVLIGEAVNGKQAFSYSKIKDFLENYIVEAENSRREGMLQFDEFGGDVNMSRMDRLEKIAKAKGMDIVVDAARKARDVAADKADMVRSNKRAGDVENTYVGMTVPMNGRLGQNGVLTASKMNEVGTFKDVADRLVKDLGLEYGVDIRLRNMGKKKGRLGFYEHKTQIVRFKSAADFKTFAHEIGHRIDIAKMFGIESGSETLDFSSEDLLIIRAHNTGDLAGLSNFRKSLGDKHVATIIHQSEVRKELIQYLKLKDHYYTKNNLTGLREGMAEFLSRYITENEMARQEAPLLYKFYEETFLQNPTLGRAIRTARDRADMIRNSDPRINDMNMILYDKVEAPVSSVLKFVREGNLIQAVFDTDHWIRQITKRQVEQNPDLPVSKQAIYSALSARGTAGKVHQFVNRRPYTVHVDAAGEVHFQFAKNVKPLAKILSEAIEKSDIERTDLILAYHRSMEMFKISERSQDRYNELEEAHRNALAEIRRATVNGKIELDADYLAELRSDISTFELERENLLKKISYKHKSINPDRAHVEAALEQFRTEIGADVVDGLKTDIEKYNNILLAYAYQHGIINDAQIMGMLNDSHFYVPLTRAFEGWDARYNGEAVAMGGKAMQSDALPNIASFKKSDMHIQDRIEPPIQSLFQHTERLIQRSDQNKKKLAIIDALKDLGEAQRINVVSDGKNIISVWRDGKVEHYDVPPHYMENFNVQQVADDFSSKLFKMPVNLIRKGAVSYNPEFAVKNIIRDQVSAMFYSKYGYSAFFHPMIAMRGARNAYRDRTGKVDDITDKWYASGAAMSTLSEIIKAKESAFKPLRREYDITNLMENMTDRMGGNMSTKNIAEYNQKVEKMRKFASTANSFTFGAAANLLEGLSYVSETSTRMAAFEHALLKTGDVNLAMEESRSVAADYGQRGQFQLIGYVSRAVPFLNANLQHMYETGSAFGKKRIGRTLALGAMLASSSAANWAMNNIAWDKFYGDDGYDGEGGKVSDLYQAGSMFDKKYYWRVWNPIMKNFTPIPKGSFGMDFGTTVEATFDNEVVNDARTMDGLWSGILRDHVSPLRSLGMGNMQISRASMILYGNKDIFTMKEVEPQWMEGFEPYQRFDDRTPAIFRQIGHGLRQERREWASPKRLDKATKAVLGGGFYDALVATDEGLQAIGILEETPPSRQELIYRFPIVRSLMEEPATGQRSSYARDFYDHVKEEGEIFTSQMNNISRLDMEGMYDLLVNEESEERAAKFWHYFFASKSVAGQRESEVFGLKRNITSIAQGQMLLNDPTSTAHQMLFGGLPKEQVEEFNALYKEITDQVILEETKKWSEKRELFLDGYKKDGIKYLTRTEEEGGVDVYVRDAGRKEGSVGIKQLAVINNKIVAEKLGIDEFKKAMSGRK